MSTQENKQQRPRTKAGRTLLVKPSNGSFNASVLEGLAGLTGKHHTEKSNSYFLVFTTPQEALAALKSIKNKSGQSVRIKFAHYRIFFKVDGLTDSTDYNTTKSAHIDMINKLATNNHGGVLYYRLYRKDTKFLGSGDLTVDTKEVFDKLLSEDSLKTFKADNFSGTHFRYKKTDGNQDNHDNQDNQDNHRQSKADE
jgi:hypothetical protein